MSFKAVKQVMDIIFTAQNVLREIEPEYKWSGLGGVLGDYGEYLCIDKYNLTKAPRGSSGFDAFTEDGKTVEIKARSTKKKQQIGIRGEADLLLVIHVTFDGKFEEIYFGDFKTVYEKTGYSKKDNKQQISVTKLIKLRDGELQ